MSVDRIGRILSCALAGMLFGLSPLRAEMLEFPSADGMKSWPKLPAVSDWHQDQAASFQNTANVLIPDGDVYPGAEAVILAKGVARGGGTLTRLIDNDRAAASDGTHLEKLADIADKDARPFTVYAYSPAKSGKWEAVAYGEEGRYFLVFTLSAQSQASYDKAFPVFAQMIGSYAEMIPW